MAFTEAEKVKVRRYMGWPPGKTEPRYDSAIERIQSTADGGVMPDSSTESEVRTLLGNLATVEARLASLWDVMEAGTVDEIRVDPVRAAAMLRSEGRRLVRNIAMILQATSLVDVFVGSVQ